MLGTAGGDGTYSYVTFSRRLLQFDQCWLTSKDISSCGQQMQSRGPARSDGQLRGMERERERERRERGERERESQLDDDYDDDDDDGLVYS